MNKRIKLLNDKACKRLLSHRRVLAIIIKTFVSEFKQYDYETIEKCIIGYSEDSDIIESLSTKDLSVKDSTIVFDLLYRVKLPNSKNTIDFIINIEPQANINTGYPIEYRAIYYATRLLAIQKTKNTNYSDLKKVYSIWICADKNVKQNSSISLFDINETKLFGNYKNKADPKLINVIIATLGDDIDDILKDNDNCFSYFYRLIRLLLTKADMSIESRSNFLEKDYDILITKEDIDTMHWSNDIEESGYIKGFNEGKQEGITLGKQEGIYQERLSRNIFTMNMLMSSFNLTFDEAAKKMKLNKKEKEEIFKLLNNN